MRRKGYEPNLVTYAAIILGFCKKRKLEEAFAIFRMLKSVGIKIVEFAYAILIHGVCKKRNFDPLFHLLGEMENRVLNPGIVTFNTVINGLCKVGRTVEADNFSKGIVGDVVTYSTLLHGYIQQQSADTKRRLEKTVIHKEAIMCSILIKALLLVGLFEDARSIYRGLPQIDGTANSVAYTMSDGSCKSGRIGEALEIFDELRKTSNSSAACYNCIISGLCKKGMVDMALDVFIEYIKKGLPLNETIYMMLIKTTLEKDGEEGVLNVIARIKHLGVPALNIVCNDAICLLCKMGFTEASCNIFFSMKNSGLELTSMCYYLIIRALLSEGKRLFVLHILTSFVKVHGMYDLRVSKTLVHYLCLTDVKKALEFLSIMNVKKLRVTIPATVFVTLIYGGRVLDAYELLIRAENNLPVMNVVDYSIMVDMLCKNLLIEKALDLCFFAKRKGVALNTITYNSVIHGLCHQGCLVEAFRLFDSMEITGVATSNITYGTLIDALVKEGLLPDARTLFERMLLKNLQPNTHIYNSLINGCCNSSLLEEAIKLFCDLEARNLKPDSFTVSALISGYCQKGDMEGALNFYYEFRSKGLLPDFLGFLCAIRGLCSKGRMEESRSILREMLQTPSVIVLLCKVDSEVKSDSVENLLCFLCEQGNILEAVTLLGEVESLLFSGRRNYSYRRKLRVSASHDLDHSNLIFRENGIHLASSVVEPLENMMNMMEIWSDEYGKSQQLRDFDSFYALLHSLCSKGELSKANKLTKLIMQI